MKNIKIEWLVGQVRVKPRPLGLGRKARSPLGLLRGLFAFFHVGIIRDTRSSCNRDVFVLQ